MTKNQEPKLLIPKTDVVFQSLFRVGNEGITKALISDIIKEKIEIIELNNDKNLITEYSEKKLGILDLNAVLDDGVKCNIEVQLSDNKNTIKRFLYYWSRIYGSQLIKGEKYSELKKTISIIILDYNLKEIEDINKMHSKWKITEVENGKRILTEDLELHIIEIPKAKKTLEKDPNNKIAKWMLFLSDPNNMEVSKMMKKDKNMEEAMDKLEKMSKIEELRRVAFLREKAIRDEASAKYEWEKEAREAKEEAKKAKEEAKKAKEEAKKAKEEAKEVAKEAVKVNNIENVKKMKEENIAIDIIEKVTGLSKEEIINIKS